MDLTLYENQVKRILMELDKEIDVLKGNYNKSNNKFGTKAIEDILLEIDTQIIDSVEIAQGMAKGDKQTRDKIKEMIDGISNEVKAKIDRFASGVSKDDAEKLDKVYKDKVEGSNTVKVQKQLDELESGNKDYDLADVDTRIEEAEKSYEKKRKIYKKVELYESVKNDYQLKDNKKTKNQELNEQFVNFKSEIKTWKESLQKLEVVNNYNYEEKIGKLIEAVDYSLNVDENIINDWKDLQKHLNYIQKCDEIATFLDGADPKKMSKDEIIDKLTKLQNGQVFQDPNKKQKIGDLLEVKNNKQAIQEENDRFKDKINTLDILKVFPDEKKNIIDSIYDNDKSIREKWNDLQTFIGENKAIVQELGQTDKQKALNKKNMAELNLRRLKDEKQKYAMPSDPIEVTLADTTKLDLSELGLGNDFNLDKDETGAKYDFAEIKDEEMEKVVDEVYAQIYGNENALKKSKEYFGHNNKMPITGEDVKTSLGIRDSLRKLMGRPTREEAKWEKHIKEALMKKVIEKSKETDPNIDKTEIDLSDFGLSDKFSLDKNTSGEKYDFSELTDEATQKFVVDKLYGELYKDKNALEKTKEYLTSIGVVVKKVGSFLNSIKKMFNKNSNGNQLVDKQLEGNIKAEIRKHIDESKNIKENSQKEVEQYEKEKSAFEASWKLNKEQEEKFRAYERKMIVQGKGGKSAKDIVKSAKEEMDEERD